MAQVPPTTQPTASSSKSTILLGSLDICSLQEQEVYLQEACKEQEHADREKEQAHVLREQESELAKQEECKKYKNRYVPTPTGLFLHAHSSFPLNMREAEEEAPNLDDDILTLVCSEMGPVFQSTAVTKAKDCKVPDEANHRMLRTMKQVE
ncbi:hypothetical protein L210DRAFT_3646205 [Boletus edulis BED1]|uniref:Uncharacterized protein n=1 Tax=Boletus edulis BED1 TaxID=1328754 RepID=A0AAD4BT23_BOLED|nr:hypothetical protein L210DRAFT_3646205 [Boletus edulis BED1]